MLRLLRVQVKFVMDRMRQTRIQQTALATCNNASCLHSSTVKAGHSVTSQAAPISLHICRYIRFAPALTTADRRLIGVYKRQLLSIVTEF